MKHLRSEQNSCVCDPESVTMCELAIMSIQTYFKPKDGLPNPKGLLSLSISSQAIAPASSEVAKQSCACFEITC